MAVKIVILGAGPGGYVAAVRASKMGAEVTLIEADHVGGTCLNRGCIPSKVMKTTAEMLNHYKRSKEFGVAIAGDAHLDMKGLMTRKETVVQTQAKGILNLLANNKIEYLRGKGKITASHRIEAQMQDGGIRELVYDKLILATGSEPYEIPSIPFDGQKVLSSSHVLELSDVPKSLVIVGGGVIGCEFAFIFSSFGTQVTMVEGLQRLLPLPSIDEDCSRTIAREMKKRKIKIVLNRTVESVENHNEHLRLSIGKSPFSDTQNDETIPSQIIEAEKVLICVGRKPNTEGIGLKRAGVALDQKGWIIANDKMETNVDDIFAIGDVLGPEKIMLAHVASSEGIVAVENAMGGDRCMKYDTVPGAIFTIPEVANVGLTEAQAKESYGAVRADSVLFRHIGKAHVIGEIAGQVKIISEQDSGKILGVHIVGPHATDLIAEGTLAVQKGCTVKELAETIHAHPTLSEAMMETAMKSSGMEIHG
ncbi:MAG: dihydrolipoyl dehydrogenase [Desulfobacteraceae bacterium]|nr:dihydrolipoyl dehydrogenase [Desulfobacteraceae bacterium]MBC2755822.1 dihydrolipoyl dehydrogenase [Desulfobacteraceae bacterium]